MEGEGGRREGEERDRADRGAQHGEADGPAGEISIAEEVVFGRLVAAGKPESHARHQREIDDNHRQVERAKVNRVGEEH